MLELCSVTVRYGSAAAVDRAELVVGDREIVALLGPSGCGKSTLLRAIAGIEQPAAGEIRWNGVDLADIPVHRRGFGLMFQDGVLFPHRTVAGNVSYGLRGAPDAARRVTELLDLVGLPGYGRRRVATLSGGEAQRVALARALAPRPALLLLDEPLAALDRALRDQLLVDLGRVLRATGTAAIFVTHDRAEAFAIADRLAVMRAGRIVQVGEPDDVWAYPADDDTARFLGCTTLISAGTCRIGLRPAALVADPSGPLTGEITAIVPGPDRARLTVRLAGPGDGLGDWPGDGGSTGVAEFDRAGSVLSDSALPGSALPTHADLTRIVVAAAAGALAGSAVQAVTGPDRRLRVGGAVRLRIDTAQLAQIGLASAGVGSVIPVRGAAETDTVTES